MMRRSGIRTSAARPSSTRWWVWTSSLARAPRTQSNNSPTSSRTGWITPTLWRPSPPNRISSALLPKDFFPISGSRKAFQESQRIYALLGAADKISTAYDSGPHGTTQRQREAIYAWMRRWLKGESGEISPEPEYQTEYEEDLLCTWEGKRQAR